MGQGPLAGQGTYGADPDIMHLGWRAGMHDLPDGRPGESVNEGGRAIGRRGRVGGGQRAGARTEWDPGPGECEREPWHATDPGMVAREA